MASSALHPLFVADMLNGALPEMFLKLFHAATALLRSSNGARAFNLVGDKLALASGITIPDHEAAASVLKCLFG